VNGHGIPPTTLTSVERFHINHIAFATRALICLLTLTFDLLTLKLVRIIARGVRGQPFYQFWCLWDFSFSTYEPTPVSVEWSTIYMINYCSCFVCCLVWNIATGCSAEFQCLLCITMHCTVSVVIKKNYNIPFTRAKIRYVKICSLRTFQKRNTPTIRAVELWRKLNTMTSWASAKLCTLRDYVKQCADLEGRGNMCPLTSSFLHNW